MIHLSCSHLPDTLDPTEAWNYQHFLLIQAAADTLIRINESGRTVAALAKKWSIEADGKLYHFEMNAAAKFHNGHEVTAEDVAFSIARHFWPGTKSVVRVYLAGILEGTQNLKTGQLPSGIKMESKTRISFRLKEAYPPFLSVLAMPGFSVFQKGTEFKTSTVGSGPMKATRSNSDHSWLLVKNLDYDGIAPKTEQFCLTQLAELDAIVPALKAKKVDIVFGAPFSELDHTDLGESVKVFRTNSLVFNHLFLNPNHSALKYIQFRRALEQLFHSIFSQEKYNSSFQQFSPYFMPQGVLPRDYYQRKIQMMTPADFLLRWQNKKTYKPLRVILAKNYFSKEVRDEMEKQLSAAGIAHNMKALSGNEFNRAIDAGEFDIISIPYVGNFGDPDGFVELLHAGSAFPKQFQPSQQLATELDRARFMNSQEERLSAYSKALINFEMKKFIIPLYRVRLPILHHKDVHIPDTCYRYEADLRNILWQVEKK